MSDYHTARAAVVLADVHAHANADPAPLADAARNADGDMHAGVILGPDGTIHAHTRRDAAGTYRVHETAQDVPADMWSARHHRNTGPTVHVPLWRVFSGQGVP